MLFSGAHTSFIHPHHPTLHFHPGDDKDIPMIGNPVYSNSIGLKLRG
jgi:hypothetical protein